MCNDYKLKRAYQEIADRLKQLELPLRGPAPNLQARDDIRITDSAPIIRLGGEGAEMVNRRWSWASPQGKPVFNFRGENRRFLPEPRCVIPADGFYEFTAPEPGQKLKTKWLFSRPKGELLGIAGIFRPYLDTEAFTMLTAEPGEDVRPIHNRQIVLSPQERWADWLEGGSEQTLIEPSPAGFMTVERVMPGAVSES